MTITTRQAVPALLLSAYLSAIAAPSGVRAAPASECASLIGGAPRAQGEGFSAVATYVGQGGRYASTVGPGPKPGSERYYTTYLYLNDTYELAAIDPDTGAFEVYRSPVKGEYGARAITVGPDRNVYLGTLPTARLAKLDVAAGTLVDLGRPSPTEEYIWDLAFGSDGKLYGGTAPNARLVRYDPATGQVEDLGRMDATQQYAHYLAASKDGFVYVGIGTAKMNVVAYRIASRERREILPEAYRVTGQALVRTGRDGKVYAVAGKQSFRLEGWTAVPIEASAAAPAAPRDRTSDGRSLSLDEHALRVRTPATGVTATHPYEYAGRPVPVFSLAAGPDRRLYASSVLPARLLAIDPQQSTLEELGNLGGGEVYRFLATGDRVTMAAYSCAAPLMAYDPRTSFQSNPPKPNPALVNYPGADAGWRPLGMVNGPDGRVYVGAIPGYGKLGGPLLRWDVATGRVDEFRDVAPDQGITALTVSGPFVVGGTTTRGGGGTVATRANAEIFLWDTATQKVVFHTIPVPKAEAVENLVTAGNGRVYGIAGRKMFVFNVQSRSVEATVDVPFPGGTVYGGLGVGPDGRLWGLAGHPAAGIFVIDPSTNAICLVARPPEPITGGFAIRGTDAFYASGAKIYRYAIPTVTPR